MLVSCNFVCVTPYLSFISLFSFKVMSVFLFKREKNKERESIDRLNLNFNLPFIIFVFFLTGFMADEFGSYAPSFYTAGALGILGATMGCLVSFTKRKTQSHNNEDISCDEFIRVSEKVTVL